MAETFINTLIRAAALTAQGAHSGLIASRSGGRPDYLVMTEPFSAPERDNGPGFFFFFGLSAASQKCRPYTENVNNKKREMCGAWK